MKKKLLVTGSGGMVGHYVKKVFDDFDMSCTDINGDYPKLDVVNTGQTKKMIQDANPDIVLHLAAATDVDKCEKDPDWAYACNKDGTRNVAMACRDSGATMVYLSSGSVFSGRLERPAKETDEPDPVNTYGKSKLAGEREVQSILNKFYIVRAGWMMGGGPEKDKKFIGKIMKKILGGEKHLKVINDKFGSPVYAKDLLLGIKKLLNINSGFGVYHMVNANERSSSRYDITVAIKEILKKDNLNIEPVSSEAFDLAAPRAFSEELENFNLKKMKLDFMQPWKNALKEYLSEDWNL